MHSMLPKNPRALLNDLEAIERVMDKKHNASLNAKAKKANTASAAAKGSSKKHPASGSPGELRVPKKAKPSKVRQHCKAKGGPNLTHNSKECRRYNGNGNPVSSLKVCPRMQRIGGATIKKGKNWRMPVHRAFHLENASPVLIPM